MPMGREVNAIADWSPLLSQSGHSNAVRRTTSGRVFRSLTYGLLAFVLGSKQFAHADQADLRPVKQWAEATSDPDLNRARQLLGSQSDAQEVVNPPQRCSSPRQCGCSGLSRLCLLHGTGSSAERPRSIELVPPLGRAGIFRRSAAPRSHVCFWPRPGRSEPAERRGSRPRVDRDGRRNKETCLRWT